MKQHFVNTKKGSRKFWTSLLKDVTLTISFGKIGTAGRELKKTFRSKGDGKVALVKLIKEKLAKGYVAVESIPIVQAKISQFSPMNHVNFWALIESSLQHKNFKKQGNFIRKQMTLMSEKDVVEYDNIFSTLNNKAYTWHLWAAAYTIHSGCSDDGFADFRGWLISRGKSVYENSLSSPDNLATLGLKALKKSKDGESFLYIASTVYEDMFQKDIRTSVHLKRINMKIRPSGHRWPEGNTPVLQRRNPNLFALFHGKLKGK